MHNTVSVPLDMAHIGIHIHTMNVTLVFFLITDFFHVLPYIISAIHAVLALITTWHHVSSKTSKLYVKSRIFEYWHIAHLSRAILKSYQL